MDRIAETISIKTPRHLVYHARVRNVIECAVLPPFRHIIPTDVQDFFYLRSRSKCSAKTTPKP